MADAGLVVTTEQQPSVGCMVHYVSHGTPLQPDGSQAYTSQCRAAVITDGPRMANEYGDCVSLCVLNPTGMFFDEHVCQDETSKAGGTWHWPERVGP
jgi:hypothetical protein